MAQLEHELLFTLTLEVAFQDISSIGDVPKGQRRIAPVVGGTFDGAELSGHVISGQDWVLNRTDGVMELDVRLTLCTTDGANIYMAYRGRFLADPSDMARFAKGEVLNPAEYSLLIVPQFECGDDRYAWLNDVVAVGKGRQTATGPVYEIYRFS